MKKGGKLAFIGILMALAMVVVLSMMVGRYPIEPNQLWNIINGNQNVDKVTKMVFFEVRLPRMIAAILIGAALSVSGASYQGILRNPMVAPDILGASSGASFGAALGILLECNSITVQFMAFFGGLTYVTGEDIKLLLIPFLLGVLPLLLLRWKMNVLCFSDEEAGAMGMNATRVRAIVIR